MSRSKAYLFKEKSRAKLTSKYKSLFLNLFEFEGLEYRWDRFFMEKLLLEGQIAAFKQVSNDEVSLLGLSSYHEEGFDLIGEPLRVTLSNERNAKQIPSKSLTVNKDVVIMKLDFIPYSMIQHYVEMILDVESTIRTNLKTLKMPFIIKSLNPKVKKAIQDILNDEEVVSFEQRDIEALQTQTQFIIDKLYRYKVELEHELLTVLGIDNVKFEKSAQMNNDEINANNDEINAYRSITEATINQFWEQVKKILSFDVRIKPREFNQESMNEGDE